MKYALLLTMLVTLLLLPKPMSAQFPFEECSNTEAWLPMSTNPPRHIQFSTTLGGALYMLGSDDDSLYALSRLEGGIWTTVSVFAAPTRGRQARAVADMIAYKGGIYIRGHFSSVNSIPGTAAFAKWDGIAWRAVEGHPLDDTEYSFAQQDKVFSKMTLYNDELVVSGPFRRADDSVRSGVLLWNGARWQTIAEESPIGTLVPGFTWDSLGVTSYAQWRGDLYVGGSFITMGGVVTNGVARWNGTSWSSVGDAKMRTVRKLFVFHDKLYVVRECVSTPTTGMSPADQHVVEWDGVAWRNLPDVLPRVQGFFASQFGYGYLNDAAVAVLDDKVYLTMTQGIYTSRPIRRAYCWDGTVSRPIARPDSDIDVLVAHDGMLIAGGNFTKSCEQPLVRVARLCLGKDCSGISGRVVAGGMDDCADSGAPGEPGRVISFDPSGYAITDEDGFYRRYTAHTGDHTITLVPLRHSEQVCPISPDYRTVHLETIGDFSAGNNFAVRAMPNMRDLQVGIVSGVARRGRAMEYVVSCVNVGTVPLTGYRLVFRHNPLLVVQRSTLKPSRTWEGEIEWEMDSLGVGDSRSIRVTCMVPADKEFPVGLCASIRSDDHDDAWPADNIDSVCTPVLASLDPNDIAVHPAGSGTDGTIQVRDSILTYTVRFQNTGNDTAFRVVVYDTLDRNLDMTSLVLGPSSHPFKLHIEGSSALVWEFNDIMLPTSNRDFMGSQGFFKYSVRLRRALPPNTRIANRAGIYFDYNAPVITNTVISTIPAPASSVESDPAVPEVLAIYPNPTRGPVHLKGSITRGSTIEVRDLLGVVVRSVRYEGMGDPRVDLGGLAAGVYMVSARTAAGDMAVRVTLVK